MIWWLSVDAGGCCLYLRVAGAWTAHELCQEVQQGTTAMMTQQHHVFLYDLILCPLR